MDAAVPAMNRARYRELDAKVRRLNRRTACPSCVAPGDHVIDKATAGADSGLRRYDGVTAAVGHALSLPELARGAPKEAPALLRRVSVLAGLYGMMVTERPKDEWYSFLSSLTSPKLANDVRKFVARLSSMDEADALTVALTFAFLQGALGARIGVQDETVAGYQRAMESLDHALATLKREQVLRAAGAAENGQLAGLGALGNWLTDQIADWIRNNIGTAFDWVIAQLAKLGKQISDLLCRGFKALFTGPLEPVGGVMCSIVQIVLGGLIDTLRSGIALMKTIFLGLANFFAALFNAKWEDAAMALVTMVNTCVVIMLGGPFSTLLGIPMTDAEVTDAQRNDGIKSLETIGKELPPTFTVVLIAAVLGVVFGGPTPVSISSLIVALTPAVAILLAPALKNGPIAKFRNMDVGLIKLGIETIVKIGAMVVAQVMSLADTFKRLGAAVQRYFERWKNDPKMEAQKLLDVFTGQFQKRWDDFMAKVKTGSIGATIKAMKEFLKTMPDLLLAIAMSDSDLKEIAKVAKEIASVAKTTYQKATDLWNEAFAEEPDPTKRIKLLRDSIDADRSKLDVLCRIGNNDKNPLCVFPNEQQKERVVTVEKNVCQPGQQPLAVKGQTCPVPPKPETSSPWPMLAVAAAAGVAVGFILRRA